MTAIKPERVPEWYVIQSGGRPVKIVVGRADALLEFACDFQVTVRERRQLTRAAELGMESGETLLLVGYGEGKARKPDRTLTRLPGPTIY